MKETMGCCYIKICTFGKRKSIIVVLIGGFTHEDPDIKKGVQSAYNLSVSHLEKLEAIFIKEQFAKPNGFTQRDVNMNAPCLYSDTFCLTE